MKLLALVLVYALHLISLVAGCRELGETCGNNMPCCGEDTGETICHVPGHVCRAGNCQPEGWPCGGFNPFPNCCGGLVCSDPDSGGACLRPNQADASAHLRGAIDAVKLN